MTERMIEIPAAWFERLLEIAEKFPPEPILAGYISSARHILDRKDTITKA